MTQAALADSTPAPGIPPIECVNRTIDPYGEGVHFHADRIFTPDQRRDLTKVFVAKQVIADEVERLLAILDALDGDPDLEASGNNDDPRLDDAECDLAESEPSLGATDTFDQNEAGWFELTLYRADDLEQNADDDGIADLDGLREQFGRVA